MISILGGIRGRLWLLVYPSRERQVYFRKILALVQLIVQGKQANLKVQKTKDLNIRDANLQGLNVTFFDLAGGQRQRIFWKQHIDGTQGIIVLINCSSAQQNIKLTFAQLSKLNKNNNLVQIPIAICLHKADLIKQMEIKRIEKEAMDFITIMKLKCRLFVTSIKTQTKIRQMMVWLLKQTKPL